MGKFLEREQRELMVYNGYSQLLRLVSISMNHTAG
jgi:hypothetical protein